MQWKEWWILAGWPFGRGGNDGKMDELGGITTNRGHSLNVCRSSSQLQLWIRLLFFFFFFFTFYNCIVQMGFLPHTCLSHNCIFRNKNHQNPEHSIIFRNTSANVSPHLWNKSNYQILWENRRAIHCAPPILIPRSWEHCLPIMLDCPPVQSFHNSTVNFTVHASVTFLVTTVTEGHSSWYAFLNVWKHLLFAGDGFAGARSIDSAMLSLTHKMFSQMASWFWSSMQLAVLQM